MKKEHEDILRTLQSMTESDTLTGCFADIPIQVYHHPDCPGVSSTTLKGIIKRSYRHHQLDKIKDSHALRFGNAFHCFVNEPDIFVNTYQIIWKKQKGQFLQPGMLPLDEEDFAAIKEMQKKLYAHPDARELFDGADFELTFFSRDQETGILKKCRVDGIKKTSDSIKIFDLKSCQDASEYAFASDCRKYLYRVSAAYYLEIVSEVYKSYLRDFYLIPCEKTDPYENAVYRVSDRSISQAEQEIRQALKTIKAVKEQQNAWTGLPLGVRDLSI